ncbi:MAG: (Fe-S)-binding protein [Chloroflexota bacterium]
MTDPFADLREDLLHCNKCGSCAAVCPTYNALRRETTSARGRVSLIAAYLAGEIEATAEFEELLYYCLSCRACAATCPNGVRVDRLVLAARAALVARDGKSPVRRAIFGRLLPYPGRLDAIMWPARLYQACGMRGLVDRSGIIDHLPGNLSVYGQMLPRVPIGPAKRAVAGLSHAHGELRGRVGYFLGCAQNLAFPDTARATVALLNLAGFDVVTPPDTTCCGMPAYAYGEVEVARGLAERNVAAFSRQALDAVVTDCASCGSFLKEYDEVLGDTSRLASQAEALAKRTYDVAEFLAARGMEAPEGASSGLRVTYHDPCHLIHAQGVKRQPRQLLQSIPGLMLVEMRTQGACCGSAGSYALTHPRVSVTILGRRIEEARETGAELVATGCPACRIQLEFGLRKAGLAVRVRHTTELLAAAYGLDRSLAKSTMSGT